MLNSTDQRHYKLTTFGQMEKKFGVWTLEACG